MPRVTLACAVALLGAALACTKSEQGPASPASPGASVAGTERAPGRARPSVGSAGATGSQARLAQALVEVASVQPSEAVPCERTCGRLGDCLIDSDDYRALEAGALELECLDLCVHAPAEASSRRALLACEQRSGCGELRACAEAQWAALTEVRRAPKIEGFVSSSDPCKDGCRWLYACAFTGAPPVDNYDGDYDGIGSTILSCQTTCETMAEPERETYAHLAECLPSHCSLGLVEQCWENQYY